MKLHNDDERDDESTGTWRSSAGTTAIAETCPLDENVK